MYQPAKVLLSIKPGEWVTRPQVRDRVAPLGIGYNSLKWIFVWMYAEWGWLMRRRRAGVTNSQMMRVGHWGREAWYEYRLTPAGEAERLGAGAAWLAEMLE